MTDIASWLACSQQVTHTEGGIITRKITISPTPIYHDAKKRLNELKKNAAKIEKRIESYPVGKIHISPKKNGIAYLLRTDPKDKSGKYIHKSDQKTIKSYLQKKYDMTVFNMIKTEISSLEQMIKKSESIADRIRNTYSDYPPQVREFIEPIDISDADYVSEWLAEDYTKKEIKDETPFYLTDNGEHVRSKSEINIANLLFKHNIPYKYECPLKLSNGRIIHPDFTILDIRTRRVKYWEHRGMMDSAEYANHSVMRIREYERSNIKLGDQLIITEETSAIPLGTKDIEDVIEHYL